MATPIRVLSGYRASDCPVSVTVMLSVIIEVCPIITIIPEVISLVRNLSKNYSTVCQCYLNNK